MPLGSQEAASDSVPPDPKDNAGWAIRNGVTRCESQPRQLSGCSLVVVGDTYNCEMVWGLEIERPPTLSRRRRIVPGLQVAVTRRRGLLIGWLRLAKWTLRVEVLHG
jgi:hypothetical protein